jgi:outer membrane protein
MRKILITLACVAAMVSSVSADFVRVEGGAGIWQQTSKGDIDYTDSATNLTANNKANKDTKNENYVWLMIKHPIPIVPNLRVEYVSLESAGKASGKFKNFNAGVSANTLIKMNQYDIIPYYNILDNLSWVTLDLGIDLKVIDTKFTADSVVVNGATVDYSDTSTIAIPLAYLRSRFELPITGLAIEGIVKYIGYDKSYVLDALAKVDYTFDFIPVVQPAIELGYRVQNYKYDDENGKDGKMDIGFSGPYVGMMLRF